MRGDPTGSFDLAAADLRQVARRTGAIRLPILIIQEGGYTIRNLRLGARSFFSGLLESWYA